MTTDFETFVEREQTDLLRLAYLLTGSEADARDLVQDCLTRAFANWERVGGADSVGAYVRTMIVNSGRSWWTRFRLREIPRADVAATDSVAPVADRITDAHAVWAACLALPRHQRVAVVLRFYEDLPYAQIGEITGCSESTARSHVFRGLKRMQQQLGEEEA